MNKKEIAAFFDRMAPEWDANMIKSDEKINFILDAAGVKENSVVLDVACGTGVMFPYYLARSCSRITSRAERSALSALTFQFRWRG